MATTTTIKQTKVDKILKRLLKPVEKNLTPDAAQAFLRMKFDKEDIQRMNELTNLAKAGTLSEWDHWESETYMHLGCLLDLLQSLARHHLKK